MKKPSPAAQAGIPPYQERMIDRMLKQHTVADALDPNDELAREFYDTLLKELGRVLHANLDVALQDPMTAAELPVHAVRGRRLRLLIIAVNDDGTVWETMYPEHFNR